jgi:signal transduction histidine kinase
MDAMSINKSQSKDIFQPGVSEALFSTSSPTGSAPGTSFGLEPISHSLLRIAERLNSTLEIETLLDILIQEAMALIGAHGGCAGLYSQQGMICHKYFQGDRVLPLEYCWPANHGLPGWLIVHRIPYLTNDALADAQIVHELCLQFGVQSALSTPILDAQGEPLGFFELHNKEGNKGFGQIDQDILLMLSHFAAIAIQNALAYQKLQQSEQALQQAHNEFISMASHELKTPVTSIKGYTQLLSYRFKKSGDEEAVSMLGRMDVQLNQLTQLIRDLLDVSKMQRGQLDYREEPFDLGRLVQEIVENVQATVETHRLMLDAVVPTRVYGERGRIGQVVNNLLANAIKYSPKADRVIVRVTADAETAVVSVQDFGIGIAEAQREQIFERFYQISEQNQKPFAGLGLGLYICNEITRHHHGRIWVESRKGKGSTFSFTLPLHSV